MFYHYQQTLVDLEKRPYDQQQHTKASFKPNGLWLSDETAWNDWCVSEEFRTHVARTIVDLSKANILCISNINDLNVFERLFAADDPYNKTINKFDNKRTIVNWDSIMFIDWQEVARYYDGIAITPYLYEARLSKIWYYGWDVSCACVWDLTNVTFEQTEALNVNQN